MQIYAKYVGKQTNYYAELIFNKRKELKMTQQTVADYLEVTRRTYQRMEGGNISLLDLLKLCELLQFELLMVPYRYIRD